MAASKSYTICGRFLECTTLLRFWNGSRGLSISPAFGLGFLLPQRVKPYTRRQGKSAEGVGKVNLAVQPIRLS